MLLMFLVLTACTSPATKEDDKENAKTITYGTSGTLYPTSFYNDDDELTGYEVEIMKEVAKRLDVEIKFVEMGVDGMLTSLKSGQLDIASTGIDQTEEAEKDFSFTEPYKYSFSSMVVRSEDADNYHSVTDVKGKKAGGAASTSYTKTAEALGAEPVIYDNASVEEYFSDLVNKNIDVIMNDYYIQREVVGFYPQFDVKQLDIYYNPDQTSFVLDKGNSELIEKANQALDKMREDGTLTKLSEQFYDGSDVSQPLTEDYPTVDTSKVE